MRLATTWAIASGLGALFVLLSSAQIGRDGEGSQQRKAVMMTRLYTGTDGQTHAEEIEAKFTAGSPNEVYKLMSITGAELHRAVAGSVQDWHNAPRRQYVVTLSGQGEVEVAGGKKIHLGPGHIDLVEDTTGKGHITRTVGKEDRITLSLPLSDQSSRASTASR
jgi:quercetin dioxygenase-like cupin family protein